MELIKLGSIRLSNKTQIPGFDCSGSVDISFDDTVPGQELQWMELKSGLLVADRCACTGISWEDLDKRDFVFGTPITIDGETYLCRCLKVGAKEGELNEWDSTLNEIGEDDDLWHWVDAYFWGQETSEYGASNRAVRGYYSARYWDDYSATGRRVRVGFRPALEHLDSESCSPDALLGSKVKIYCSDGVTIEGCLVDFSNYDIVLETSAPVPTGCSWATKGDYNIIIGRENIIWLKEA